MTIDQRQFCRACENIVGNPDHRTGEDPGGLCWVCWARFKPIACAGCDGQIPAMYAEWIGSKPHCEGCAEDTWDDISRDDPADDGYPY